MNFCKKCGTKTHQNDDFCSKCGCNLKAENTNSTSSAPRPRGTGFESRERNVMVPAMQTADGKARYEAINKKYLVRRLVGYSLTAVLALLACLLAYGTKTGMLWVLPGLISVISIVVAATARWDEADYYSVPGSRDINGEHRCIHCGHRGIYKRGEYKTNNEHAQCSKCKVHFWTN